MDSISPLAEFERHMHMLLGRIGNNDRDNDQNLLAAVRLMYDSSRQRIFDVADNMMRGIIRDSEDIKLYPDAKEPDLPKEEVWDFHIGDTVAIKLSKEDFKWMQNKTVGWNARLNSFYGHVGIIENVACKQDCNIRVYFPEGHAVCNLYAGVLKKVDPSVNPNLISRWNVGDLVQTISCEKTLTLLQRGLNQLPKELIGTKGRVVAVTEQCVMVTFDEDKIYYLNSAGLVPSKDKSPVVKQTVKHARGFEVGEKVKIISNVKKLIENQKGHGGWNSAMSILIGKPAIIVHIEKNGTLILRTEYCRDWRVHPDSVLRVGEKEAEEEDLKFLPHDIIKVIVPRHIQEMMAKDKVPKIFLYFLRTTAIVTRVETNLEYSVRFSSGQNIRVHENLIRKATTSEKQKYESIEKKVKELKIGDNVYLDIGPPNFVQTMIRELELDPTVAKAMVNSSELLGFINPYTAVIKYGNGVRFRVKKEYLTIPEKFHVDESKDAVNPFIISRVYDVIKHGVQDIHSKAGALTEAWKLDVAFTSRPPCVEYKIESTVANFKGVCDWLNQNSEWEIELLEEGQFLLRNVGPSTPELKVKVIFNDEESVFDAKNDEGSEQEIIDTFAEDAPVKQKAEPFRTDGGSDEQRIDQDSVGPHTRTSTDDIPVNRGSGTHSVGSTVRVGVTRAAEEPPKIDHIRQFKYMKLHDPSLARDVYFPYFVHGQPRTLVQDAPSSSDNERDIQSIVHNIRNFVPENF